MTLYVCKWLHIVRTYPTLVLVRDRGLGGPRVLPLLLAFRLPPRLLATLVDPPPPRIYVRGELWSRGESIDYASNDFSLNVETRRRLVEY